MSDSPALQASLNPLWVRAVICKLLRKKQHVHPISQPPAPGTIKPFPAHPRRRFFSVRAGHEHIAMG